MQANDVYNLRLCMWREARGEPVDAQRGVYWVVINRANDTENRWPKAISAVILQPKQFSSFNGNDPNFCKYPFPTQVGTTIDAIIDEPGDDPTGGANSYHSFPVGHPAWPKWATEDKQTAMLGHFRFYRL